jgi:hypothetical protein
LTDRLELVQIFNDSYHRIMSTPERSRAFYRAFYDLLMASSREAASKFRGADMEKQIHMLQASVTILLSYYAAGVKDDYLERLAERHGKRGVDISPELYAVWLKCLVENVRRFDSRFNEDVEVAWRSVFEKGIEFMTSRYNAS